MDLFSVHIRQPWMLHAIFQRCDLAREVRWRWRPISISLMDWKRFTHKSNKPGGRMCAHTLRHSGHFEITSPAVSNKQDNLCVVFSQTAARNEIAKWVRGLLQRLCDSAFWNVLFKAMKCLRERAGEHPSVLKTHLNNRRRFGFQFNLLISFSRNYVRFRGMRKAEILNPSI